MWLELRRRLSNHLMLGLCAVGALAAIVPLFAVIYHVVRQGASSINWAFFTELPKPIGIPDPGLANAIVGSLLLVGLAGLGAVPVGVVSGIYLARATSPRLAFWVRFAADVLSGVPSIVMGVVVYQLVVLPMKSFSALSGGVALALIMVPTVVRTTEEMVRLVPETLYEAALALGIPHWRATASVLVKGAAAGIVTGIMVAAARVAGETAPLLFTSFSNEYWSADLAQPIASLPVQIFVYAISPYNEQHQLAWAGALVLLALVLTLSIITRVVTRGKYELVQ